MNSKEVISSFTDTIIIIASEANGKDPETQRRLLIQVIPFFNEILSNITPKFKKIEITKKATSQFLIATSDSLSSFLQSKDDTKQLADFLQVLVTSRLAPQCSDELTRLMTSLISAQEDPQNALPEFIPFIEKYFQNPDFRSTFINTHGFETAWCAYFIEKSNVLIPLFFDQFALYPSHFSEHKFRTPIENLLSTIASSLSEMTFEKCQLIITKLSILCHEHPTEFYDIYEKVGMFDALNKFLLDQKEEGQKEFFVTYFITYSQLVPFEINNKPNHPIIILVSYMCDPSCSKEARKMCLDFFIRVTDQRQNPFKADKVSQIAATIPLDDPESIVSFSQLCYNLQIKLHVDLSPIIPTLVHFCTYDLMSTIDIHNFLLVFIYNEVTFSSYMSNFFVPLFDGLDSQKIVNLFNKYNELYTLFTHFFGGHLSEEEMVPLLHQFLSALPFFEDKQRANAVFWDSLLAKKGYLYINTYLTSIRDIMKTSMDIAEHTFSLIIKCALTNMMFCMQCISDNSIDIVISFYTEYNFSTKLILNFISALTNHRYIPEFDSQVLSIFKDHNFLNETPENLLFLALGLQIGQEKKGATLCFPSILHRCTPYEFTSPYDLWLCGQISLELWLEEQTDREKDISKFPSIISVARQYIKPMHSEMILKKPALLEKIFQGKISHVPLFEFPPLKSETTFTIPLYDYFKSLSFWLYISDFGQSQTTILTLNTSSLSIRDEKLLLEGKEISPITKDSWHFLVITFDESNGYAFLLNEEIIFTCPGKGCPSLTFGSKYNTSSWFIGGAIRVYKEVIGKHKIKNLITQGPKYLHPSGYKEMIVYSAYDQAPLFKSVDPNQSLTNTSRPVTIYSIYNYIKRSIRGATPLYIQSIDMIDDIDKLSDMSSLISTICSIQKMKISGWTNSEFSLFMSIIVDIRPQLISQSLIDNISNCFIDESNETFDWESFLDFTLDYTFFFSEIATHVISLFFQFNVRFPIPPNSPINSIFTHFLLSLVILPDIKLEYLTNIYDLLQIHCKDPAQIIRAIISYPDFANDLQDYSSYYEMKTDETVRSLLNIFLSLPISSFTDFYVLRLFEAADSFKILEHVMQHNFDRIEEALDTSKILNYCFENISYIQAWEISISIFLKRPIRLDDIDIDFSSFDMNYFSSFLKFLTPLVFVAVRLNSTNFWNRLCVKFLSVAIDLLKANPHLDQKNQTFILLMMTLGCPLQNECIFPPGPTLHSTEEIIEYSVNRGQIFPENQQEEEEKETHNDKDNESPFSIPRESIYNLSKFVPTSMYLTPKVEIQMDLKLKELSYVITEKQLPHEYISNWDDYLKRLYHDFGIEKAEEIDVENSNIVSHLSQFIIQSFHKYYFIIETILSTCTRFPYKLSVYWMQHLSIETLQLSDSKEVVKLPLITYVCDRLLEGWYSSLFLIILSSIFSILQQNPDMNYSNSIYMCILYSMDLVHSNQVSMLGDLFVEYENVILKPGFYEKLKFVKVFITRGISLIPFLNPNFSNFWLRFLDLIENSDVLKSKWSKKVQFDFNKVMEGLRILGKEGFVEFTNHKNTDPEFWESFDTYLQHVLKTNMINMKATILNNLNQLVSKRKESDTVVISMIDKILSKEHAFTTYSRAIASSVRYFTRRTVLTRCDYYLKKREKIISLFIPFNESTSERCSLSILSDPIFPTRRKIKSPLEYVAPAYPSGTSDVIFEYHPDAQYEYSKFPECVTSCLATCRYRIPSILRRSPKAIHARFAANLPLLPSITYQIFLCICNEGKKFDFTCECSLLYGVDVLEGVVFINSHNLIFLEGDKIRDGDKMFHVHQDESGISQEIYMQFFQSGLLAPKIFTFDGHFAIITEITQIIAATNHLWIQMPYSVTLNYSLGYNFVLNFDHSTYNDAISFINKGMNKFMEFAPSDTPYLSPIHSSRLLQENLKKLTNSWYDGELDNFTYLSLINRIGKRCFPDLTQYPVFPWVISDYVSETFPPLLPKTNEHSTKDDKIEPYRSIDIQEVEEHGESESESQNEGPMSLPQNRPPLGEERVRSSSGSATLFSSLKSLFGPNMSGSDESDTILMDSQDNFQLNEQQLQLENEEQTDTETENENFSQSESDHFSREYIREHFMVDEKMIFRDLTKPMGQLGEDRAKKFDQIYEDSEHVYFYGTHYLHFGVVVYFMFRIDPFSVYSFILHRGWDHPNRIFLKVNETWLSASMKSQSDVKELVPQMYKVPDYLTNVSNFNFESQYDKINVANVELPKWAKNDRHFMQVMCRFLEARYVTKHLNSWIDLIFGVNSRGQGAINTKNLFHPTCYPESAKISDKDEDQVDKQAKVTSIINFGQISPQIFNKPHPQGGKAKKRRSSLNTSAYDSIDSGGMVKSNDSGHVHLLSNFCHIVFQRINCELADTKVQDFIVGSTEITFASTKDSSSSMFSKIHLGLHSKAAPLSSAPSSNQPASNPPSAREGGKRPTSTINLLSKSSFSNLSLSKKNKRNNVPPLPIHSSSTSLTGNPNASSQSQLLNSTLSSADTSTQNSPRSYEQPVLSVLTHAVVLPSLQTHKINDQTVASISLSRDGFLLCKAYIDGHVQVSRLSYSRGGSLFSNEIELMHFHTSLNLGACDISSEHFVCFVACGEAVLMFDLGMRRQISPSIKLGFKVTHISIDDEAAVVWIAGGCEVTVCTISGDFLFSTTLQKEVTSLYASPLPEYVPNRFTCVGHNDGSVSFLNFSYRRMSIIIVYHIRVSEEPIVLVKVDAKAQRAIAVCSNNEVYDFEYVGSNLKPLESKYFYECANCKSPIKGSHCCSCCNRFLCPKCVAKDSIKGVKVVHFCQICNPTKHKQKDAK